MISPPGMARRGARWRDDRGNQMPCEPCLLSDIQRLQLTAYISDRDPNLARYNILSLHSLIMPWATAIARGTVPHRFLLREMMRDRG